MVVVVEGFNPPVTGLDGESAADAFGREEVVPVFLTVGESVLQIEGRIGEDLAAVGAHEALGVERAVHGLQAVLKKDQRKKQEFKTIVFFPVSYTHLTLPTTPYV